MLPSLRATNGSEAISHATEGDCFGAHLPVRAVHGKTAPRNDTRLVAAGGRARASPHQQGGTGTQQERVRRNR